jgi:hypothetical protein
MGWKPPPPERQCTAQSKQAGRRCGKWAVPGATVCRNHGGGSPQVRAAAQRNLQAQAAQAAVRTYGLDEEVHPAVALEQELHRTAGAVAYLRGLVGSLDATQLGQMTGNGRVPSIWVELYLRERKHLAEVAATCLRVGMEERRVKLAEDQGAIVADLLRKVVTDLGHDPADEHVRGIVRRHLMAVPA